MIDRPRRGHWIEVAGQRWKALVVGGTDEELEAARDALSRGGLETAVRPDAIGTCAYVVRERPDVVLLDPEASVLPLREIVGLIRDDAAAGSVVVLIWAEGSRVELSALAREVGADGWVMRGGDPTVFARDVRQWADRSAAIRVAGARESSGVRRAREVLFVHGQESAWRAFEEQLGRFFSCRWARSGRAAYRVLLGPAPPAVVVSEVVLPDLGGDVLYRTAIRRDEAWSSRFVFVTALPPEDPLLVGLRAWPVTIHHEPWAPLVVLRSIEGALREAATGCSP